MDSEGKRRIMHQGLEPVQVSILWISVSAGKFWGNFFPWFLDETETQTTHLNMYIWQFWPKLCDLISQKAMNTNIY
jgi:hypothetical protein